MTNEKTSDYLPTLRKIEALEAEIERLQSTPFSEEAYEILQGANRKLTAERDAALARLAEIHEGYAYVYPKQETGASQPLYAAAGASPQPSQELQSCSCRWDADDNRIATCTRHQGWLDVVGEWADRAKAAESKLAQPTDDASAYAKNIAIYLWKKFYKKEAPTFEVCDGLYDVLSQIDNMVTGLPMPHPPHTPRVGDLRTDVVNPMAAWPFETEASVEARQRAAFEAKGV